MSEPTADSTEDLGRMPEEMHWRSPRDVSRAEWRAWRMPFMWRILGGWRMLGIATLLLLVFVIVLDAAGLEPPVWEIDGWGGGAMLLGGLILGLIYIACSEHRSSQRHRLPPIPEDEVFAFHGSDGALVSARLSDFDGYLLRTHPLLPHRRIYFLHTCHGWIALRYVLPEDERDVLEALALWLPKRDLEADEADPLEEMLREIPEPTGVKIFA